MISRPMIPNTVTAAIPAQISRICVQELRRVNALLVFSLVMYCASFLNRYNGHCVKKAKASSAT